MRLSVGTYSGDDQHDHYQIEKVAMSLQLCHPYATSQHNALQTVYAVCSGGGRGEGEGNACKLVYYTVEYTLGTCSPTDVHTIRTAYI